MSDNMPDFDKMSQEEIMAWMETLAKRQGASEGFTTAADMDIAEVDPSTAIIDEPGYVPYGQEKTQPLQAAPPIPPPSIPEPVKPPVTQTPPVAPPRPLTPPPPSQQQTVRPPVTQAPPAAPPRPLTPPSTPPPSQQQTVRPPVTQAPPAAPPRPLAPSPSTPPPSQQQTARPPVTQTPPAAPPRPLAPPPPQQPVAQVPTPPPAPPKSEHGSLAWLESLAADQGDDLFNLDLSDLPADTVEAPAAAPATNPMTWLEDLARSQVAEPSLEHLGADDDEKEESEKLDPFAQGVNPMEWLETLAKRQGAKEEELTTGASLNVPATQEAEVEQDGYQPFSFDTPPTRRVSEPAALENPADFLTSLAGSEGYSEEGVRATQKPDTMSMASIQDAIADGTVSREQMQHFLEKQSDELAEQPEISYTEDEDSEPIIQGELPDWLADLRPEPTAQSTPEPTSSLDALFDTPAASDMPSWLTQDLVGADVSDLDSIFAPEDEEESRPLQPVVQDTSLAYEIEVDPSDPWVEAFDEEYAQGGAADIQVVPDWYRQNTTDPERIAAVEGQTNFEESAEALEDAALPVENSLSLGQAQAVPEWAGGVAAQVEAEDQPAASGSVFDSEMPDWLKEVEQSVTPEDVPDWLVETISTQEDTLPRPILHTEPVQQVIIEPPQPVAPPPPAKPVMPKPVETLIGDVAAVIERARDREQSGDLEGALAEYETMIRTNSALDAVVNELSQLVKSYQTTPAVYRVLGDGLMRQGKLQAALNTYREALNQL